MLSASRSRAVVTNEGQKASQLEKRGGFRVPSLVRHFGATAEAPSQSRRRVDVMNEGQNGKRGLFFAPSRILSLVHYIGRGVLTVTRRSGVPNLRGAVCARRF